MNKEERAAYQREYRKRSKQAVNETVNEGVNVNKTVNNVNADVNSLRAVNKELQSEVISLRAEVSRLKQLLAARAVAAQEAKEIKLPKGDFVSDFSAEAQAKGRMVNNSPLGRMARGEVAD